MFQSTHPVRGATVTDCATLITVNGFQSTHPVRGATSNYGFPSRNVKVSIHAPREGCDQAAATRMRRVSWFQSTHPVRGATNGLDVNYIINKAFQSTHPVRGATARMDFASQDTDTPTTP